MYLYVYDETLQDRRYERDVALMETRLTDLGIAGKIARLALFRDPHEIIRDEVRRGVTTVVAVGNDSTLRRVIDAVSDKNIVVAILPFGKQNEIAGMLGVPAGVAACDVLSARLVEELDTGSVNGMRFLHEVRAEKVLPACRIENKYTMTPVRSSRLFIRNLADSSDFGVSDPTDGRLEFVIYTPKRAWLSSGNETVSKIPVKNLSLSSETSMTLVVDGESISGTEFDIKVLPKQIRIVTGKERKYIAPAG